MKWPGQRQTAGRRGQSRQPCGRRPVHAGRGCGEWDNPAGVVQGDGWPPPGSQTRTSRPRWTMRFPNNLRTCSIHLTLLLHRLKIRVPLQTAVSFAAPRRSRRCDEMGITLQPTAGGARFERRQGCKAVSISSGADGGRSTSGSPGRVR